MDALENIWGMGTAMKLILTFLLAYFVQLVVAQIPPEKDIANRLESYSSFVKPQKVYLHLDKPGYSAGETIWFKAYTLDGLKHKPDSTPDNLYVELVNSEGVSVEMRILLLEDGVARGDILLGQTLADGNYLIKAYTDWMKNFSEESYFTRYLYIRNQEYENVIPRREVRKNKRFNRRLEKRREDFVVGFFPEGGNFLPGISNRIAVKITDRLGNGQEAEGEIIDSNGNLVEQFTTEASGVGVVEIQPRHGDVFHSRISINGGRYRRHEMPQVKSEGYGLRIDQDDHQVTLKAMPVVQESSSLYSDSLTVTGHTRGLPFLDSTFATSASPVVFTIQKGDIPAGVAHFTLFNSENVQVAERLIFVDGDDGLYFNTTVNTVKEGDKDYIVLNVQVTNKNGELIRGDFSASAVAGSFAPGNFEDNIYSYLLLDSDLRAVIENHDSYADTGSGEIPFDNLMLTQAGRIFKWEDVIEGEFPAINFQPGTGLKISGRLIDPAKDESLSNYPVQLAVKSGHDEVFTVKTEQNGTFNFQGLKYKGTFDIELSSRRLPGNYPPVMELVTEEGREFEYIPGFYTKNHRIVRRGKNWERVRGISKSGLQNLNKRSVTPQLYGVPDQTIYIDHETSTDRSLFDVLRNRGKGLRFEGGQIIIRGPTSFVLSNEPRFMVDGVFVDRQVLLNMYPADVERIEIFKGTRAAIFGVRGGTGVILAYSKMPGYRGFSDARELVMLGYHTPGEFYSGPLNLSGSAESGEEGEMQTIFWEPDIKTGENGTFNFRFPVHSGMGRISLCIEGISQEGQPGFARLIIDVEE